jgi:hypothetical protein
LRRSALAFARGNRKAYPMIVRTGTALLLLGALATLTAPALADGYPVSGRWGESASAKKGPIDCTDKRVITFRGEERFDTGGGVPGYHNESVRTDGSKRWRIVDQFSTGQISAGSTTYTLEMNDADHISLALQGGSTLKLQRCK